MQIWITFILISIIHQTHVSAAPVDATFGKIADAIINPAWTFNNPDSPKKDNKDTDLNKKNDENLPITVDGEVDYPNTKNKKKNNSRKKNKRNGKKRNNNKKRKRKTNSGRRNNTRRNGRYLWYSVYTVDDVLVNLPEYRNHEDEQNIVLIWDDKRRIVQNEHVDALSMNNLNNNQLIRQKRDYNNILELQDNILQTRNINQHDLKKNENSMSNSNENTNENMKFLNLRNSNTNKFKNILQNRKKPTNTIRNKISRPNLAQGLGVTLGADNSEKERSQLKIIQENPQKINAITTLLNDKPELIIRDNTGVDKNTPEIEKIDTLINGMNSNSDEGADDDQDSESYPSSIETKNKIPNYSDIEDNKQHDIIKNIKHQFKPKSRKLGKKQPKNNDKGTLQTRFTPNAPSTNQQITPSIDIPEHKTEGNTDIAKNIPVNDEIETLINTMNSNSEEDSSSDNSDSNTSSLEKQQDILDFSDLGDNKGKNLLKSIKQPLKPISNIQGETFLENNEKLPEIYEKYLNNPSEINTKKEKGTQQKGNAPTSQSINNQQTPSINIQGHITPEHTDVTKNIPVNDEIETLMNAINSNSEEGQDNQNSESNPSSLETKQEIPNYSNVEDNKQHDILKNIKHPFKPKSRKLEKKQPENNDKGTLQTRFTPNSPNINQQKTPSIDIPEHKTEGNTDIAKNIPVNDDIDILINTMNSNSEEDSSSDYSDSNTSSLEKQQDILDFSDLGDNKGKNLLKSIKQPLKPISNIQGETFLENNEKLPEIYEKYLNNPSEINTKKEKGTQQKGNAPTSQSINNQQTPSINIQGHITPEHTDVTKNIPVNDEIETLMNAINSNSEEGQDNQNSESNPSSLETKQEIPNYSNVEDNKQHDILKNIKHPFKPKSRKLEKKQPENNDKGTLQTKFTPNSPSINQQKTPSIDIPEHKTEGNTDIAKNIPVNDEIDTLINTMNSNSEEDSIGQNLDSNPSSIEKQQDALDFSDLGDDKGKKLLKTIKQPLKPISNMQGKKLLINNEKLPGIYKQKNENPLEINKKNEEEPQQKTLTPITQNLDRDKIKSTPAYDNLNPYIIQKKKSIKTPDLVDTIVPKTTDKIKEFSTEIPFKDIDVIGSLESLNKLGGITMEYADVEKLEDKPHSSALDYNNKNDHDDIHKIINQPILKNLNTGKSNTEYTGNDSKMKFYTPSTSKNIEKNHKRLSESWRKKKLDENTDSNSIDDLLRSSISIDEVDLSEPELKKKKVNPKSKTGNILKNSEDTTLNSPPRDNDLKPNIIHKRKSIKTPDLMDTINPETNEEIEEISIEIPLDDFDVTDSLEDLNNRSMTMKSAAVGKLKDKSPFSVINNKNKKNHKDSLRKTNQNPNKNINKTSSPKKTVENPKPLSGRQRKKNLDATSDSNSMDDLLDSSLDFDEVDLSQQGLKKKKVIPISKTNDIIKNVEPNILKDIPKHNDDKSNTIQQNKSINTPDLIDTTVPKSTEKVNEFSTESPLNAIDVSDPLGDYKNLGGLTIEHAALEKIEDESPSTTLNNSGIKDHDDSHQVSNQPMEMNPKSVNPNTEYESDVDTNTKEIPKKLCDGEGKRKSVDEFGSNSYGDMFGGSLDFDEEDLSQPGLKKKKVIPMSKTNDITYVEDNKVKTIPTNIDDKLSTIQKNKSIKTPDLIDTTVPKSTEKVNEFSTESPLNAIDVSDPLGDYKNLGGLTIEHAALEKIEDESPSTTLNNSGLKDHDDSLQVSNQPMEMNPKTVNPNTEYESDVDTNTKEIPKQLSDGEGKRKSVDEFGSNSYGDMFGGSLDFDEEDLSLPGLKKKKVIPMSKTNDITNVEEDKVKTIPTNIDNKLNTIQKNKSIKTPDLIDTTVPKSTEKVNEFSTESPLNAIDVSDPLGDYKNLGGLTIEHAALEKIEDESPSTTLNNSGLKDHDDSLQVSNQPMEMNPKTVNPNTEYESDVDTNSKEIPKKLSDGEGKRKSVDEFGSNSYGDMFGGSLDFDEEDLSLPGLKKKKVIPMSKTNDITNVEEDKVKTIPTNIDNKLNTIQKNKSIKTPDLIDTTVPKSTEKVNEFSTESPLNAIDVSDPLGDYKNLGGLTIEHAALEKIEDESPSTTLNNSGLKDHDDSLQVSNQPMEMNPKTVNPNTEYESDVDTNSKEIPKKLSDGEGKRKSVDEFGSNSYGDMFGGSLDFDEEDLSLPGLKKKKVIPMSKTNDITTVEEDKVKTIPTNIDNKLNTIQKNKSIKTPDLIDTTVPKSTEKVNEFSTESPLNAIDVSDPLGDYKNLGGLTIDHAALEKIEDESPSTTLNNSRIKDHDDSLQVSNQPMEMNPKTVNPNTEYESDVDTNSKEIPKKLSDGEGKRKSVDEFGSNSYGDMFGGSLDFDEEDLSLPGLKKKKVIPMSKTNDITNVEEDKVKTIPTNIDNILNTIQKNKSIKTPDLIDTTVPKSTEKVNEFSTESPLNAIDVSDPLGDYKNLGGLTIDHAALEKIEDESPSTTLNNSRIKDHDDSLQVSNQPMEMNPKSVNPNTEYESDVDTNSKEIPKKLSDGEGKRKSVDEFGSNSYGDMFGGSLDFDEEDLSLPGLKKKKVIPMSKTNDITNVEEDKVKTIPTNIDNKLNTIQKNKSIKTPDLIDTTVPKSTEKVNEFSTESPLNAIDVSDPLGDYKNLGGLTIEHAALEKIEDESPSTTLNNSGLKDHDDSLQVSNQPMEMNPKTVNPNTEYESDVDTNSKEIPKKLSDGEGKRKSVDEFGSNSYGDMFGGSLDFDEEDLSLPGLKKKKVIPMSKTNDITNVEEDKVKTIPTNIDNKLNTIQKNKSIKTPDLIDTTVPKSTEKVNEFSTESPLNAIDVSDPLGDYKNLGGLTIDHAALEKIEDESPSTTLNNSRIKDHDDSLQVSNQPMEMNPKTVNPNTEYESDVDTNSKEIPKKLSDGEGKRKSVDEFGSNSYGDMFGGSLDFDEEDLSLPGLKKKKVIPMSKTNDITNVEEDKVKTIPTNIDNILNTIQKNKSIKTPDLIDTTVPKSTEKVNEFSTESPLNAIDVSDPLGDYKNLGGLTIDHAALEKIEDESPSTTLNNSRIKDHDDSLQVSNQPMEMNPKSVNPNTEYESDVDTNTKEIPKKLSDGEGKRKSVDEFGSNSYGDMFGGSLDFDEEDLSLPGLKKKKVIPMSKTNDITNVEEDKVKTIPTNIDNKLNTIQKNKSIKTPDLIDTTVPKSTEKVYEFSTESPLNAIDVSDPLGDYKNLGGLTIDHAALEKIEDESPSTTLNNSGIKDHDDSLQVSNQPMEMNPKSVNPNTEYESDVDTNTKEIPKKLSDGEGKRKSVDEFGSNSYGDMFGASLDFDEEDLSQPGLKKKKVIPKSKTNDITNVEDNKVKTIPTNIDDKLNTIQKNKSIKTPDLIDTTVTKSTEKVNEFSTESPLNVIDVSDPLEEYKNLGGLTIDHAALEKIEDESPSTTLNNSGIKDHDDSLQVSNQPMEMNPKSVNPNTEYESDVDTNTKEIPKKLSDGEGKRKSVDEFGSNSYGDIFGGSLDFDEEDLSLPGLKKKKVIPMSKTNDITNVEEDKVKTIPTNIDNKLNTIQKNKSIKTPDLIDTTVPKSTEKVNEFSTESPLNAIDVSDPLGDYKNLGGLTIDHAALEKIEDESPSTTLNNSGIKDHDDSLQVSNQPMEMNPKSVNPNTEYESDVDTNTKEIPKKLSDGEGKRKSVDEFGSNSYGDMFGGSLDFDEEDLSLPGLKKKKVIPKSKTNDITNVEDNKVKTIPTNIDDKLNTIQKNKSIKTPDLIDTTVTKSTEKVNEFSTESPLNVIDVSDPLEEYKNLGGFTIEDAVLEKMDDESPSTTLNNSGIKDHDDSLQVSNQPMEMNPKTVNPNTEYESDVDTNTKEIPKKLSDGEGKRKSVDEFGSNSYGDMFGGSLDFDEEDLSLPGLKKKKVIPMSKTNDITNVEEDKVKTIPTNIDNKLNTIQKNKSIKTPDLIDTTVPKSTEKVNEFSSESPLNAIDVSDPMGDYKNLGGLTIDHAALEKIEDESPSTTLNNSGIKDHDDSLQVSNQPMEMNPKSVNPNTEYESDVDTNTKEIPKKLSDGEGKRKSVDEFGSNSYGDMFGGSLDFDEEDLSQPGLKKKKVIPMSKTNDITNVEDNKVKTIPTYIDDKLNTIQKNKSIKTPDLIDTTVPKSTEKVNEFSTESPLNVIDVSDPLGEYKNLGGFTIEDAVLEKMDDESPSTTLNNSGIKDHDDSLQVSNQPMEMNPKTVNPNTEYESDVDTNTKEIPKKLTDDEGKRKLVDKFGSNSYGDLFGDSLDFDEEDLSQPGLKKNKNIPMSKINDITNIEDDKLKTILTNIDDKLNTIQKNKSIKTPDLIDTTVPKSTEKVNEFSTESPLNVIDVSDPLRDYKNLGGLTIEHAALEKIKYESPSTTLNSYGIKDHGASFQVTNQPMEINPKTVNSNTEYESDVDTNTKEIPKKLSDGEGKSKSVDEFGSNSYGNLFGDSLDFDEEDLSQPGLKKNKSIPISKINDITNIEDDKLNTIPTNIDDKHNTIQKNKSIKKPDLIDTTVPKSTEKVNDFSTELPLNVIDVSDPLGEYKNLGGFTIEDAVLEKMDDESPSTTLNNSGIKDHDDSLQVSNQPMELKSKTVNPTIAYESDVDTNIKEIPKKLFDGEGKRKLVDNLDSKSYGDMFGGSLDFDEEDLSQPGLKKEKVIPMSKTNVEDDKVKTIPTNINDKHNTIQKNKSIKTHDLIDTTVPKSTEKVNIVSTDSTLNVIDVSDPMGEYKNLGGFTIEDAALEKIEDESPSTTLNSYGIKDHDASFQVTNQPMGMNPKTVNPNIAYKSDVDTNTKEIPKKLTDDEGKRMLVDKFGSNSYGDLFGDSLDFDEEDLSQPGLKKNKNIPMSKINDITNIEDDKLKTIPTNIDDKLNTIQKNKSIKTPDLIDTTVPKSTEKVNEFSTESPLNVIDVSDPLGDYKNLEGLTIEHAALEKIKYESPSTTLNSYGIKDHDASFQVTNQPMEMNPKTVNPNIAYKSDVDTNIEEIPKKLSDGEGKRKLVDNLGSSSYGDMFGGTLDFDEEDLSQPGLKKKKVIPMSKTNDNIKKAVDDKLKAIPAKNVDIKPYIIKKKKSIKMPDFIDTTVPNTNHRVNEFSPEIPFTDIHVSDSLEGLNNLKGITMEDVAMERIEDKSPSAALNNYRKKNRGDCRQKTNDPKLIHPVTEESTTEYNVGDVTNIKTYTPSTTTNIEEIPNILPNLDDITFKSTLTDDDNKPNSLPKNKLIKILNSVSNTDSKLFDLMEPTTQINYDIIKNDNKLPLSKIPSNVVDKHSSNSKTMHNYNNNSLNNDKDVTFNRSFITNHFVEYNSKDVSSLEDGDRYGNMSHKFSTIYNGGDESNYNLWETIPPKKSNYVSLDKGHDNTINDFNDFIQSSGYSTKNNNISTHTFNENNILTGTERVKNIIIHNKQYDDFIKQLFKKIDNIDDKLAKLDKVSHNCFYVRETGNIRSHEPTMNNILLTNDIPNTKPEKVTNIEDSSSKTNKLIKSLEINISNKSDNENEINKNESSKVKKHKNKKHKRHGRDSKKKGENNNKSNNDDDDDDKDNDDDNHKNNKRHKHKGKRHNDDKGKHKKNKRNKNKDINKDDDGKHKKNKRHKNKDLNDNDNGKHKKNKRHKNKDLNDNDNGKHKKNKRHKKKKKIDDDNDNGGHRKKNHKKKYSKVDNDVVSKHKKHRSHKKKDRNYNDVEILRNKKTNNKKKKKLKENVYSPEESNDVNYSSSIQINSENNDSVKRLKTISSKSKISKKSNSTKSKKSSPKKKSKYVKHSKTIKYKNKEIPVDISDEDTNSNENNYDSEKTYIKYISNNNQKNVPKDKKHKHKKHNKHSKTNKTYIYKKIPEDKDSDENSVNLEETYNINIISDDDALRQKKHRHKKNKKKKNFDINIVKDTDTDTQVLNNDKKTQNGFQFYRFYPQYRYVTLNPFARLLTNSYL